MQVTIRLSTEVSYSLSVLEDSTVEQLRELAKTQCPLTSKLPTDFKLIFNGVKLSPEDKCLKDFNIHTDDAVILMSDATEATTSPAPKKTKKKNKCSFTSCSSPPLRMVGSCSHCSGKFCAKHRLLEDHLCQGLQFCKDNAHERNAMKLNSERTIVSRV